MKNISFLLVFGLFAAFFPARIEAQTPIVGIEVTLSDGQTAVTDATGNFKFPDLPAGVYFVKIADFGIKEQGIKCGTAPLLIENLKLIEANLQAQRSSAPAPISVNRTFEQVEVKIVVEGSTIRGSISKSRSNIK